MSIIEENRPHIKLLATGGTIAGRAASETATTGYKAGAIGIEALLAAVPEINEFADISGEQICSIDSKDMTENIWIQLADRANELLSRPDVDGLVITHGTDTMEETAYFLQLTVRSYKPIILTGAMRPATAISADGPLNLMDAVRVAANPAAWNKGVLVVMNGQIDSAREVTKTHTTVVNTFQSPGLGSLGMVNDGQPAFYRDILKRHTADSLFEVKGLSQLPRVKIIYGCTNNDTLFAEAAIKSGVDGIIYAGMGNGSITKSEEAVLAQAAEQGIVVVRSTRCMGGAVIPAEASYTTEHFLDSDTLNPVKSRILLKLALTKTHDRVEIQRYFHAY